MGLDPSAPEMTMLLVMLHTGTMFAVIVYFWKAWMRDYFSVPGKLQWFALQIIIASFCTGVVYLALKFLIKKFLLHGGDVEELFSNLFLIAAALAAVGILIIFSGWSEKKSSSATEIQPRHSIWIGVVQGFCIPFRGFSRSGSTISTGLLFGLPKQKLEEFSFALAVVLTPAAIAQEAHRLIKAHSLSKESAIHLLAPGFVGMIFSFIAGMLALKWLSHWLESGRWKWFGYYCLLAAVGVLLIHFYAK